MADSSRQQDIDVADSRQYKKNEPQFVFRLSILLTNEKYNSLAKIKVFTSTWLNKAETNILSQTHNFGFKS